MFVNLFAVFTDLIVYLACVLPLCLLVCVYDVFTCLIAVIARSVKAKVQSQDINYVWTSKGKMALLMKTLPKKSEDFIEYDDKLHFHHSKQTFIQV